MKTKDGSITGVVVESGKGGPVKPKTLTPYP